MGKKRKRERNKCIAGTVSNWLSAMKAKASCHVNYSWCLAQRGGRGGLWKPLSSGKFAYVDSGIGERGGVLLYKINGMHNVANFLTNVLYFLFAAKKVIGAEVSNKCVGSSHTVSCIRETTAVFWVWPKPFSCSFSPSQSFQVRSSRGDEESQWSIRKVIHAGARIWPY